MSSINSYVDDDVNWKFIDKPYLRDDGGLMISGSFEVPRKKLNHPEHTYSMLSDRAEEVGGLVSKEDGENRIDRIDVIPSMSEEKYELYYDGSGDFYKITVISNREEIAQLSKQALEEDKEVSKEVKRKAEIRGIYDREWQPENGTPELLDDVLYSRETHTDHGAWIEVDYVSNRSGEDKTIKTEVLRIREHDATWETNSEDAVRTVRLHRDDGDYHLMVFKEDSEKVELYSRKNDNLTYLGDVKQVLRKPHYHDAGWN